MLLSPSSPITFCVGLVFTSSGSMHRHLGTAIGRIQKHLLLEKMHQSRATNDGDATYQLACFV